MSDSKHVTYEDAGVDTAEGGRAVDAIKQMVKDTNRPEVIGGIGGFGGLFSAAALKDMEDPILISGTDGVGTKLVLAQIMDRHETVGQDLVAMCVNDILASGAEPLFFLDYVAIGHIEAEHMAKIIKGVADGCKLAGCALVGGEMAEHPGVMAPADYDLAGFTVGVVDRSKMLDPANVRPGDVILGLPSTGVHSNGYSLVRHVLLSDAGAGWTLDRHVDELGRTLGEELLTPTRVYAADLLAVIRDPQVQLHALSHVTGGGLAANLARVLPPGLVAGVDRGTWAPPPVFGLVQRLGQVPSDDLERTLNMGVGFVAVLPPAGVARAVQVLGERGLSAWQVGEVGTLRPTDRAQQGELVSGSKGVDGGSVQMMGGYRTS